MNVLALTFIALQLGGHGLNTFVFILAVLIDCFVMIVSSFLEMLLVFCVFSLAVLLVLY